jgi:hypothetical protein
MNAMSDCEVEPLSMDLHQKNTCKCSEDKCLSMPPETKVGVSSQTRLLFSNLSHKSICLDNDIINA